MREQELSITDSDINEGNVNDSEGDITGEGWDD